MEEKRTSDQIPSKYIRGFHHHPRKTLNAFAKAKYVQTSFCWFAKTGAFSNATSFTSDIGEMDSLGKIIDEFEVLLANEKVLDAAHLYFQERLRATEQSKRILRLQLKHANEELKKLREQLDCNTSKLDINIGDSFLCCGGFARDNSSWYSPVKSVDSPNESVKSLEHLDSALFSHIDEDHIVCEPRSLNFSKISSARNCFDCGVSFVNGLETTLQEKVANNAESNKDELESELMYYKAFAKNIELKLTDLFDSTKDKMCTADQRPSTPSLGEIESKLCQLLDWLKCYQQLDDSFAAVEVYQEKSMRGRSLSTVADTATQGGRLMKEPSVRRRSIFNSLLSALSVKISSEREACDRQQRTSGGIARKFSGAGLTLPSAPSSSSTVGPTWSTFPTPHGAVESARTSSERRSYGSSIDTFDTAVLGSAQHQGQEMEQGDKGDSDCSAFIAEIIDLKMKYAQASDSLLRERLQNLRLRKRLASSTHKE